MNTAMRSVKGLKNRMPADERVEFEVSFWLIRDNSKDDDTFLNEVDGKKPEQIIAMGKEIYQQRKNNGFKGYEKYASWDEMIAKFGQERLAQEKISPKKKEALREGPSVIYDMHSPNK
jgi:hypothetical protein